MKRWLWFVPVGLVLSTSLSGGTPLAPQPALLLKLAPYSEQFLPLAFIGQQRALVVASGTGATPLGLYVYDQHGNCIARDEAFQHVSRDDLAVEWLPQEAGAYVIQIRSGGGRLNEVQLAVR
jgi:hypothetical protein